MGYHVRVKICGVTTPGDAQAVADVGADAIGLNFYDRSPRCLSDAAAEGVLAAVPPFVEAVGVFAGATPERMVEHVRRWPRIQTIQSHGGWPDPGRVRPRMLVPAVHVAGAEDLDELRRYLDRCRGEGTLPAAVLLDSSVPGQFGGTGRTAPWQLLAEFDAGVPVILAGGLTPENVGEAVRVVKPFAVDVASGVESAPGKKDIERVRRLIGNAREAAAVVVG